MCPAGNTAATTLPMVQSTGTPLKCMACAVASSGTVYLDSASGNNKYSASVAFGNNVYDGAYDSSMIDGYHIHIADVDGKVLTPDVKAVTAKTGSLSCCSPQLYNVSLDGVWPANARGFLIAPFSGSGNAKAVLPVGTQFTLLPGSDSVSTVALNKATVKTELAGLSPADCDKLYNNPPILIAGVVAAINNKSAVMIPVSNCVMKTLSPCAAGRRLQGNEATQKLEFTTETLIPTTAGLDETALAALPTDVLITAIKENTQTLLGFTPTIASATTTSEGYTSVSIGGGGEQPTGDASRFAGSLLSSIIVLFSTLAGPRFFA
jgi:hypothetical protein